MAAVTNYDLNDYFDVILSANDVPRGKPFPDVYLEVAKRLGVDPAKCLVFEDISMGIMAGKNAGMTVCGIDDDYSADDVDKKKELADYYIYSYDEVN